MVCESVVDCIGGTPLVYLNRLFSKRHFEVIAKLELFNPAGSIKDRSARYIITQGIEDGTIAAGTHIIESSSGNLGIALATIVKAYGLSFTCVVDPKITRSNLKILQSLGANIDMVQERDDQGGYLKTRIERVKQLLETIPKSVWVNQYANPRNWQAHYYGTGSEIVAGLDRPVDCAVVAVSTTGTILGIARRLREAYPKIRIIAVDAVGSVIFGTPAQPRELPGIGASRVPELFSPQDIDQVVHVDDLESVDACRALAKTEGIFAGGSSGSALAAILKLAPLFPPGYRIVTLFPDRGDRYLDMVYDDEWVRRLRRSKIASVVTVDGDVVTKVRRTSA